MLIHIVKFIDFDKPYARISNTASHIFMTVDYSKDEILAIADKLIVDAYLYISKTSLFKTDIPQESYPLFCNCNKPSIIIL